MSTGSVASSASSGSRNECMSKGVATLRQFSTPLLKKFDYIDEYFAFLTSISNVKMTIYVTFAVIILAILKSFTDSREVGGVPPLLVVFRILTVATMAVYGGVLYRVKNGKNNFIDIKICGNTLLVLNAIIAGFWIYHTMKHREGPELPPHAINSCLISLCLNMIYPVHSSWASALVVISETVCFLAGASGSPGITYLKVALLCALLVCVTIFSEIYRIDSYKSHCEKQQLIEQLEKQSLAMRRLIGNVAHDLKTPLQAFVSELESIPDDDANTRESLRGIANFMAMMINRSIDFTKVQSGFGLKPSLESVNISSCIEWVTSTIFHSGKSNSVIISTDYDLKDAHEWIITDKHWLLENLLCYMSNAIKFVTEGSIVIKVSAEYTDENRSSKDESNYVETTNIAEHDEGEMQTQLSPTSAIYTSRISADYRTGRFNNTRSNEIKFIRFEVVDSGIGIPEDKLSGLFQPFFQAQTSAGGTGLGLYALANRIEALRGQYGAGVREDGVQGSRFWFKIPYRPDTEMNNEAGNDSTEFESVSVPEEASKTLSSMEKFRVDDINLMEIKEESTLVCSDLASVSSGEVSVADGVNLSRLPRVLLVDDSTMIQKASTRALQKEGFRVTSAMNGVECLQRLKEAKESGDLYCVVLLDLQMPVLDGFETVKRIREEERLSDLEAGVVACSSTTGDGDGDGAAVSFPTSWSMCNSGRRQYVIGLSANSDTESIDCVAAAGMDNFIAKPLKVSNLRDFCKLQKIL